MRYILFLCEKNGKLPWFFGRCGVAFTPDATPPGSANDRKMFLEILTFVSYKFMLIHWSSVKPAAWSTFFGPINVPFNSTGCFSKRITTAPISQCSITAAPSFVLSCHGLGDYSTVGPERPLTKQLVIVYASPLSSTDGQLGSQLTTAPKYYARCAGTAQTVGGSQAFSY